MSSTQTLAADVTVIGAGMIGLVVAAALARRHRKVIVLDAGTAAPRSDRGNFGLVWVQGKGSDQPAYAELTRLSAERWPGFAADLLEQSGIDVALQQPGGMELCLSERDLEQVAADRARLQAHAGPRFEYELLDHAALAERLPGIGPGVAGGCYCPHDGHVNPLRLLRALQQTLVNHGGTLKCGNAATRIEAIERGFLTHTEQLRVVSERVVCAAGLGNTALAAQLDLPIRLHPLRGQIMVTERVAPFLHMPTSLVRQTTEGTCLLGDSHEDVGFDTGTLAPVMRDIAAAALTVFPSLRDARIVRAWGALRSMSDDGFPIYAQSERYPGAFVLNAHSAVTLAAIHDQLLGDWVLGDDPHAALRPFDPGRFHVSH